jgi:hypothetical protein
MKCVRITGCRNRPHRCGYGLLIIFLVFLVYIDREAPKPVLTRRYNLQDETFLRRVVFPEEDRHLFTTAPWRGEFRWFRSANVTPIEHWRRVPEREEDRPVAA